MQHFASDNYAGICPEALAALIAANTSGHEPAYGDDSWTNQVCDRLRDLFQTDCEVFFVFNGTAANSLALASLCQSYHSVICHELAHIETDECGGPEFFSGGSKLLTAPGVSGKLTPDAIEAVVTRRADIHYPKPKVVTLTQSTEVGTVYTVEEVRAIAAIERHDAHQAARGATGDRPVHPRWPAPRSDARRRDAAALRGASARARRRGTPCAA